MPKAMNPATRCSQHRRKVTRLWYKVLLEKGANINAESGKFGSALFATSDNVTRLWYSCCWKDRPTLMLK